MPRAAQQNGVTEGQGSKVAETQAGYQGLQDRSQVVGPQGAVPSGMSEESWAPRGAEASSEGSRPASGGSRCGVKMHLGLTDGTRTRAEDPNAGQTLSVLGVLERGPRGLNRNWGNEVGCGTIQNWVHTPLWPLMSPADPGTLLSTPRSL